MFISAFFQTISLFVSTCAYQTLSCSSDDGILTKLWWIVLFHRFELKKLTKKLWMVYFRACLPLGRDRGRQETGKRERHDMQQKSPAGIVPAIFILFLFYFFHYILLRELCLVDMKKLNVSFSPTLISDISALCSWEMLFFHVTLLKLLQPTCYNDENCTFPDISYWFQFDWFYSRDRRLQ